MAALIAWCLPVGADAFTAGYFLYKGKWKAAALATVGLFLLWFVCFVPLMWVLQIHPGPL
jgi:hypothetical protein